MLFKTSQLTTFNKKADNSTFQFATIKKFNIATHLDYFYYLKMKVLVPMA